MSKTGISDNLETIRHLLDIEAPEGSNDELSLEADVLKHNLWGIHIKNMNTALSEEDPHVCIGWSAMGDLSGLETTEDIAALYEQHFDKNNRGKGQDVGMIRRFLKEVQVGDYIIFAESSKFHIGRIESDYYYDDTNYQDQDPDYKNRRKVKWLKKNIARKVLSTTMHNSLATAMSIFGINDYRAVVVDLLKGTYVKDEETYDGEIDLFFKTNVDVPYGKNRIIFGAPGTGKSFKINEDKDDLLQEGGDYERVTFHSNYSYANFVGTYKPVMVNNANEPVLDDEKKRVVEILKDKQKTAQEKYDLLYDEFKGDGLTRLPILLGIYTDDKFETRKKNGTDTADNNTAERNHGRAIRQYLNLSDTVNDKKEIAYEYVPGPFMRVLVKALKSAMSDNPKPYLLIVEEINRANPAAVFGDVFQLLDRDANGVSEYAISTSQDMRAYLAKELKVDECQVETIKIPSNMFIWATMNSADQGVFPMDTAFKRRWDFEYLGIDANEDVVEKYIIPVGKGDNRKYVYWNELRNAINDQLSSEECKINEDKLLGPFFISTTVLGKARESKEQEEAFVKTFESKVLMYLFEDAMKMSPKKIFKGYADKGARMTFSKICEAFEKTGIDIFGVNVQVYDEPPKAE